MTRSRWIVGASVAALSFVVVRPARAQDAPEPTGRGLAPGTPSPALDCAGWVNLPAGVDAPTWQGRPLLVEFWKTTCAPCVRTMGRVQELADRYGPHGLVVVGISPEGAALVEGWAKEHGIKFPMGLDPSSSVVSAFQVDGFPTTFVVGRDGKIVATTHPTHAVEAIEQALGLRAGAGGALLDYVDARAAKDVARQRFHLERVIDAGAKEVDLAAWAVGAGGGKPAEGAPAASKVDGSKAIDDLVRAGSDDARRKAVLDAAAAGAPAKWDAVAWAKSVLARDFPVTAAELAALAAAGRFAALADVVLDRKPPSAAYDALLKKKDVEAKAAPEATRLRARGRRGLALVLWPFADKFPKDEAKNKALWGEIASNGWTQDPTGRPVGMDLDGEMVMKDAASAWVDRQLARALVLETLVVGKRPDVAKIAADTAKARDQATKALRAKYGD